MLSELTFYIWDGDGAEFFTYRDMNRIEYNVNILAREAGVSTVQFVEADRTQQFRYDEIQKVEDLTHLIALQIGVSLPTVVDWSPGKVMDYRDFERVESQMFAVYQAMGGEGQRIDAGQHKVVVSSTLFPDAWTGNPPHIDFDVPIARTTAELFAFVPHTATVEQRIAEMEGRLIVSLLSDRVLRITATGTVPKCILPIRIALGGLSTIENKTLSTTWEGSGPWTQNVSLTATPANIVMGMAEGMTSAQSEEYASAGLHVSAVNGSTVTVRAIFKKPTIQIPVGLLYSETSVV